AEGQREPLAADRRLAAGLRRMGRDEGGFRQQTLPGAAEIDEVVAVGAIAVKENHQPLGRAGLGFEPGPVEGRGGGGRRIGRHGATRLLARTGLLRPALACPALAGFTLALAMAAALAIVRVIVTLLVTLLAGAGLSATGAPSRRFTA